VYSNADETVVKARREAVDAAVDRVAAYLEALRDAGVTSISSTRFAAYALVALVIALGRDAALEENLAAAKVEGLVSLGWELCGLA
jgi:hypothetical protein